MRYALPHTRSTKLSTTRFSPALSNAMVSLLPSTATTLPLPNFMVEHAVADGEVGDRAGRFRDELALDGERAAAALRRRFRRPARGRRRRLSHRGARRGHRCRRRSPACVFLEARRRAAALVARLRALPAGRAVARAEGGHLVEARGAVCRLPCRRSRPWPRSPRRAASGSSSRKREGMLDDHSPCMRRLEAK